MTMNASSPEAVNGIIREICGEWLHFALFPQKFALVGVRGGLCATFSTKVAVYAQIPGRIGCAAVTAEAPASAHE
jgi:hypothetical protein